MRKAILFITVLITGIACQSGEKSNSTNESPVETNVQTPVSAPVEEKVARSIPDSSSWEYLEYAADDELPLSSYWFAKLDSTGRLRHSEEREFTVVRAWVANGTARALVLRSSEIGGDAIDECLITFNDLVPRFSMTIKTYADCTDRSCMRFEYSWLGDLIIEVTTESRGAFSDQINISTTQYAITTTGDIVEPIKSIAASGTITGFLPDYELGKELRFKDEGALYLTRLKRISEEEFAFEIGIPGRYLSGRARLLNNTTPVEIDTDLGPIQVYRFAVNGKALFDQSLRYLYIPTSENQGLSDQLMCFWEIDETMEHALPFNHVILWKN